MILALLLACNDLSGTDHDRVIYVRNDGADLMAWVKGNVDSGVFLVMTHGGPGGFGAVYHQSLWPLEEDYAVVYWDQRASGSSRGLFGAGRFNYPQFGDDLRAVVETIHHVYEPTDVFVSGHSFGVEVGTEFLLAGNNQDLVKGWIPSNGTFSVYVHVEAQRRYIIDRVDEIEANPEDYDLSDGELETLRTWRTEARDTPVPEPMERDYLDLIWSRARMVPVYRYVDPDTEPFEYADIYGYTSPYSPRLERANSRQSYPPMDDAYTLWDRRGDIADIEVPTLFVWGRWDPIMPNHVGEAYFDGIGTPDADKELAWFEYSYHTPMSDEPHRVLPALTDFIEKYRE